MTAETDLAAGLTERFGVAGRLAFRATPAGLVIAELANEHAAASLCLQGGQVLDWTPRGAAAPVIWLSPGARFEPGRAIRGGVPVCWPWFGPHPSDPTQPAHGFARVSPWRFVAHEQAGGGASRIVLALDLPDRDLQLTATVGTTLRIELQTGNPTGAEIVLTEALHAYFGVGDVGAIEIDGLDGSSYVDQVDGRKAKRQHGSIRFDGEFDNVYDSAAAVRIIDPQLGRQIEIRKTGSRSTVVWSPGAAKARKLGDLGGGDAWRTMVCVESANALDNVVRVAPGATRQLAFEVSVAAT